MEDLTLDNAIGEVIDSAAPAEAAPESAPEVEAKAEADKAAEEAAEKDVEKAEADAGKVETDETAKAAADKATEEAAAKAEAEPEREEGLADEMAELSHEAVRGSKAFKGLLSETQQLRAEKKAWQAAQAAKPAVKPAAEPDEPDDDDPDADIFTQADVDKRIAKAVAPLQARLDGTDKATSAKSIQTGLDALRADQAAGNLPAGLNTDALVKKAMSQLRDSKPAVLADLMADPDPAKAIYNYAKLTMPGITETVATATTKQAGIAKERLAKGRSPETGGTPQPIDDALDVLKSLA